MDSTVSSLPMHDATREAEQRVFAGLNLAALEALSGRTAAALAACERAVAAARGSLRSRCLVLQIEGCGALRCIGRASRCIIPSKTCCNICSCARSGIIELALCLSLHFGSCGPV